MKPKTNSKQGGYAANKGKGKSKLYSTVTSILTVTAKMPAEHSGRHLNWALATNARINTIVHRCERMKYEPQLGSHGILTHV